MENDTNHTPKPLYKRIRLIIILAILAFIVYYVLSLFLSPDRNIQQIYLVPKDAAVIIQTNEPVNDWNKFSKSEPWLCLKQAGPFAEISGNADMLDSMIQKNKNLLNLVGKREMIISIHKTRRNDWDFLIVLDLKETSKVKLLKEQIEKIYKLANNTVTQKNYKDVSILEIRDGQSRDILYTAFIDNHYVASYNIRLIEQSIDERENPSIGLNEAYIEVEKQVYGKGLCRIFLNYEYLPGFMEIYLQESSEYLNLFSKSMDFAGLYFNSYSDKIEIRGNTIIKDDPDPYISALLRSGKHKMKAHEILSARTSFYVNIGFNNTAAFVKELEKALSSKSKESYDSYASNIKRVESFFGISLKDNLLGWMSGEFVISQSEPGLLGREPERILIVKAKSIRNAKENMEILERAINKRSPLKIQSVIYKDYEINYVEMKDFFRPFFGKIMDKFETPYYTYLKEYVVFSNKSASLLSFIEDYEQNNLLVNEPGFEKILSGTDNNSTILAYVDMNKFFPQLQPLLGAESWNTVKSEKDILYSFPQWAFQITGDNRNASMYLTAQYNPPKDDEVISPEEALLIEEENETEEEENENISEKALMNELKRFYVEKFQGNILREFYPDGALMSETEIKDGLRNGRHREYFESGKLRLRGRYINNRPKGVWKYYTEEGKFEKRERL